MRRASLCHAIHSLDTAVKGLQGGKGDSSFTSLAIYVLHL